MPITLASIKEKLDLKLGKKIMLTAQVGRKKKTERKGTLTETYPSVFVVELDQEENAFERVSYSYTDVLTQSVEIHFLDEESLQYA
ncbi:MULTISPECIES: Veg family protein [Carnobacterium]|uniref:Veg family protein n=1 Tax=Carnobacterium TaxID=2747 RepID=UPI0005563C19|nr:MULTISPECIES: Veg family protein [Carnobacterium]